MKITASKLTVLLSFALLASACAHAEQSFKATKDLNYNTHGQTLDIYLPQARDKRTAIMFIHGGGFKEGDKEQMSAYAALYAQAGFVTTSINYRLTPNHFFPAAVSDAKDALSWMHEHAEEYGYDTNKIVLVGYSAGGTLALNLGLADDTNVAAVISSAPATDLGVLMLPVPNETPIHKQLRQDLTVYMNGLDPRLASPIYQVSDNDPPVFLFHGKNDQIVSVAQSVSLAKKLEESNVAVLLRVFPDVGHEIMLPNKYSEQLVREMTNFILAIEAQ